ncbi:MAG: alpha-L-fucosidase [Prevotellaceae bacterium]|nr:alpha-L-fucosidase [Prevotellaceae bacterium]
MAPLMGATAQEQNSFVHEQSKASDYVWPTDPEVLAKIDKWQDQKFGVLFHWGIYSVPGIVESWSICSEDWITRNMDNYEAYKNWYWGLKDKFNPTKFNPEQWADVMEDAGMKYMIFTTKHHDGFCMFDSKYSDFSIAKGPFKDNPRKDVARYVFDAFRNKGFMMGCYFSKPDWHCQWFWNPYYATPNRRINYKKEQHPDWWKNYQDFTENQLNELMTNYGHFDILWLDGGWITGEEIRLDNVLQKARKRYPGLISVDRTIRGKNENYQTPERGVPATQLDYPWESCITLSNDWGWVPNAPFKSPQKVIGTLAEITAKGGCLLLGVGPTPEGEIEPAVVERLHAIGEWLRANGKAIYNTRTTPNYHCGNMWFTADKDGRTLYAIYALPDGETLPATLEWTGNEPVGNVKLLKGNKTLKCVKKDGKVQVTLPKGIANEPVALQFTIK